MASGDRSLKLEPIGEASPIGELLVAVQALSRGIDHYRHAVAARLELGLPEINTLAQLLYDEPVRAGDIAVRTGLTPGSVTALLDRLEHRGYTIRVRPPDNRRTVLIELTPHGRQVGTAIFHPLAPRLHAAAAEPDAPDPGEAAHWLRRIAEVFDELATTTMTNEHLPESWTTR